MVFKKSADTLFELKDYTSATILYFKTWFAIQDKILLEKIGKAPKDHAERFRLLESNFKRTYILLDKEFGTYRDTYSRLIDDETAKRLKSLVENELNNYEIS